MNTERFAGPPLWARLDDDALPDLVIFKVQVPTVATLLRGLFGEWDVDIGAVGYKNQGGKGFESTPSFRSELVVRLPAIVGRARALGLEDCIVDVVETGRTLEENGLEPVEEIAASSARLIVNRASFHARRAEVERLLRTLQGAAA